MSFDPNSIRVVLFDIGGILVELSGTSTLRAWLGGRHSQEELLQMWLKSPVVREFETGRVEPDVFADRVIAEMPLPVTRKMLLKNIVLWSLNIFPGALDLVERIPRRYIRATLCNSNALHWPLLMRDTRLATIFDRHFASHLMGKLKPDEEVFRHVCAELRCDPREVLFLDDSQLNVAAATRVGMHAVHNKGPAAAESTLFELGVLKDSPQLQG
jgi:putative hydrolase of the HAD superfamily